MLHCNKNQHHTAFILQIGNHVTNYFVFHILTFIDFDLHARNFIYFQLATENKWTIFYT